VNGGDEKCSRKLKKYLKKNGYLFSVQRIDSTESQIALKYHGHANATAPVLQMGTAVFRDGSLFNHETYKLSPIVKKWLKVYGIREFEVEQRKENNFALV
jgi:ribosomal protein S8